MGNYHFFIQYHSMGSSSRGIQSGGRILSPVQLLDKKLFKSFIAGKRTTLLYAKDGEYLENAKSMELDEFQSIFEDVHYEGIKHLIGDGGCGSYFRKEIVKHYKPKDTAKPPQCTTQYGIGAVITTKNAKGHLVYLGNFEEFKVYKDSAYEYTVSGHLYCSESDAKELGNLAHLALYYPLTFKRNAVKTKRPAIANGIKAVPDPLEGETEDTLSFSMGRQWAKTKITIQFKRISK